MSFLVAMLLAVTEDEEATFWLFVLLVEELMPREFFSESPALVGYHASYAGASHNTCAPPDTQHAPVQ